MKVVYTIGYEGTEVARWPNNSPKPLPDRGW